jgi:fermentation-respiration switch protein FrsA (DUF1100 family)
VRTLFRFIRNFIIFAVIVAALGGLYIGNVVYEQFRAAPWDQILEIRNRSHSLEPIKAAENRYDWPEVSVTSADGTKLQGTYIRSREGGHRTVILLHGLYQNRSMCLPYISMYRDLGYNVLLVDQRGHGESGGAHTEWGLAEMADLDSWVHWLKSRDPSVRIGMHGISLGAAMALLYSGTDQGRNLSFYVADSSYGNLTELGREKIYNWSQDQRLIWGYNVLDPFFQAAMFYHTHKLVADIEPMQAVKHSSAPILFLHGSADELVPARTARLLYEQCASQKKSLHIFQDSPHAAAISTDRGDYERVLTAFLK